MKSAIAFFMLFFVALTLARPHEEEEKYTDRYDNINLDEILENEKILKSYVDCILDKGKCTPEGKELREKVSESLETGCAKCSDKHKQGARRVISHLINREEGYWNELTAKYDPDNKYAHKYEKELREVQG